MKYSDLVKCVAAETGLSQADTKCTLDRALRVIQREVGAGNEVTLNGVGKFCKKVRSARMGINPATKERVAIPESTTVAFKVAKEFKDSLNR